MWVVAKYQGKKVLVNLDTVHSIEVESVNQFGKAQVRCHSAEVGPDGSNWWPLSSEVDSETAEAILDIYANQIAGASKPHSVIDMWGKEMRNGKVI